MFLSAGMLTLSEGITVDRYESRRQYIDTNANCTAVSVIGFGSAFKIDFEDVFVKAEVVYQTRQSTCRRVSGGNWRDFRRG